MSGEIIGAWALAEYGKEFLSSAKELITRKYEDKKEQSDRLQALERRWHNFNWGYAAERYKKHMQEIYGYIRVIGTTEPIPIGDIFTDVYILEKPQAYQRFDISQLQEIQQEPEKLGEGKRTRGLKIVISENGHRLYILGKPGAGKTTFMKYIVHQTIIASELNKLPIFVTLRDWDARKTNLLDFIANQFTICDFPDAAPFIKYLLENGYAIVLFDGLDEVPHEDGQRDKIIQSLHDFSKTYLETQIVITCRVAASEYSFTEFTYIEMADFSPAQVKAYVHNWFRDSTETAEDFLKELSLDENKGVRDLGRSPLLLSMICLAYDETLSIPKRRVELYEEALDALLKKWDSSRRIKRDHTYKQLSLGHKKQLFARIAADYFDKGEIFFERKDVAKKIEQYLASLPPDSQYDLAEGEAILETISAQHGILVERAKGIYSFSHLTFQEYYTAKYISDNAHRGTLESLTLHLKDSRWREVFLLTASLLHEATPLLKSIQIVAQDFIKDKSKLLATQTWAIQRANHTLAYAENAKRSLYWYLYLSFVLARDLTLASDLALARNLARGLEKALNYARFIAQSIDLNLDKDLDRACGLDFDFNLAYELEFSPANQIRDKFSTILDRELNRELYILNQENLETLLFDFYTSKLILMASIFIFLPEKERSKKRVENFQNILLTLKQTPIKHLHKIQNINCPSYQAPDQKWHIYKNNIQKLAEKNLGQNINSTWNSDENQVALRYLQANQLFWDCLQVARVEDREAVEDMILKAPDKNE